MGCGKWPPQLAQHPVKFQHFLVKTPEKQKGIWTVKCCKVVPQSRMNQPSAVQGGLFGNPRMGSLAEACVVHARGLRYRGGSATSDHHAGHRAPRRSAESSGRRREGSATCPRHQPAGRVSDPVLRPPAAARTWTVLRDRQFQSLRRTRGLSLLPPAQAGVGSRSRSGL